MKNTRKRFGTLGYVIAVAAVFVNGCSDRGADPPPPPTVPVISAVIPESLRVFEVAEIRGTGFGAYSSTSAVVFPDNVAATTYLSWHDTEIQCIVPGAAVSGGVRIRKGDMTSNALGVFVVGTQGAQLNLSRTTVSVNVGESSTVTISGGNVPYAIQTAPGASIASASLSGATLTISGTGLGNTSTVITDASSPPLTAMVSIQVTLQQTVVSFSQEIVPIFATNCVSCHGGTANLFLTPSQAYANLLNVPAQTGSCAGTMRVTPGNSSQSALYLRVSGTCSDRMPLGGSLSQADIELIRQWIDQGAQDN